MSSTPRSSVHARGWAGDLRPDTNTIRVAGYGDVPRILASRAVEELQPADRRVLAAQRCKRRPRGLWRQRARSTELVGPGLSHTADPADHRTHQLCRQHRQAGDRSSGPGVRSDSVERNHRRGAPPYREFVGNRSESDRGNTALVQYRVPAHAARRVHGGGCVCGQSRSRHPRSLQHERRSRSWRRQRRPAPVRTIW